MPKKIAMIGAGSIVFCRTLLNHILATPALAIGKRFGTLIRQTERK